MILETLEVSLPELERRTGWQIKPEGACKGDRCVPMPLGGEGRVDVPQLADRLGMPLVHDEASGLWCLGPEAGGRALSGVQAPDLVLPDIRGGQFSLRSMLGKKVLLVAWASW
ncbi:MAG: hypothetical protein M3Q29_10130 [Chloroflexota bacterium]|nr:hypothetical protein [Chloroflexota bacterium]